MASAKHNGFLEHPRQDPEYRSIEVRKRDFEWVEQPLSESELHNQAKRCMDCGVPFCHAFGCPLGNRVPDYIDEAYHGNWKRALELLHSTNNFPEFTGRICPALCEASCTLSLGFEAAVCRHIEMQIAERGWQEGWIRPYQVQRKTGKEAAVIGSGPAGLAAAQQLVRFGHDVVVFEQADRLGGMLRYGIPNFKLEKWVIDRRLEQLAAEGVRFETEVTVGSDISARYLLKNYDAVLIASGTSKPRDLDIPGRSLSGIYRAMDFLTQQTRLLYGDQVTPEDLIDPAGKHVVVIGGGDTGADCVGTCIRRNAKSVTQLELLDAPPASRSEHNPWPQWPVIMKTSSSHTEGCSRLWSVLTKEFYGVSGKVEKLGCAKISWGDRAFQEIPGSDFLLDAQLVLLSMGFVPDPASPVIESFSLETDSSGTIAVDKDFRTSQKGVFAAGDTVTGASLVVRAMNHGRNAADSIDQFLNS